MRTQDQDRNLKLQKISMEDFEAPPEENYIYTFTELEHLRNALRLVQHVPLRIYFTGKREGEKRMSFDPAVIVYEKLGLTENPLEYIISPENPLRWEEFQFRSAGSVNYELISEEIECEVTNVYETLDQHPSKHGHYKGVITFQTMWTGTRHQRRYLYFIPTEGPDKNSEYCFSNIPSAFRNFRRLNIDSEGEYYFADGEKTKAAR